MCGLKVKGHSGTHTVLDRSLIGLGGLCRHNFGNNRHKEASRIMRE